ncbi:type I-C CRISPR-associated protein Cas5c [Solidesulfovibrio alcoholivorans]|uniref:type I-C CRISPR-associated protein Cas5c n=1 Tax=Solidesulfovibrio alcoholivorans TaxID=81406 RepID=UPI0004981B53|nr:type I-C CRISPR-associated protein Cas5c [Solidesulfovibrio alcoholivorans]
MAFGVGLMVRGDYACFTRPEMKSERVSYDVMTPSAARGILEAVYWKPEITWVVDRIHVLSPIRFTTIRRNELGGKMPYGNVRSAMKGGSPPAVFIEEDRQQRAALVLRDVAYVIDAHFDVKGGDANTAKHKEMFERRARKGQCFHQPYLGCREFPAAFECLDGDAPQTGLPPADRDKDLGFMLHDIDFARDMTPRFFRARLQNGILTVPPFAEATA